MAEVRDAGPRAENRMKPIERVVMDLSGGGSRLVLPAVIRMARELEAELVGLYIRDEALVMAAAMPGFRVRSRSLSRWEEIDQNRMESALEAQAMHFKDLLSYEATRYGVRWSFRALEGSQIAEELKEGELLVAPAGSAFVENLLLVESISEEKKNYSMLLQLAGYQLFTHSASNRD